MVQKPLRERDGALVDNWYIACLSAELRANKPIRRVVYDRPYVLFRDTNGHPACLPDRCLHRGAQLSRGKCDRGFIVCPYHGWKYDSAGKVGEIPSEGPDSRGRSMSLKSLAVKEQDGSIWVWMGDEAPRSHAPPWRFPFFDDADWIRYFMVTDFDNEVTHLAENFMDVPHTVFVHRHWFRNPAHRKVPMKIEVGNGSVLVTYDQPLDSIGLSALMLNPRREPMVHTDHFIFPNLTRVDYQFGGYSQFIINSQCTPVSTLKSRVYTYIAFRVGRLTRYLKPILRPAMHAYTRVVINQDVEIMHNQGTNLKIDPRTDFRSTEADEVHIAIERIRDMGIRKDAGLLTFKETRERHFWI